MCIGADWLWSSSAGWDLEILTGKLNMSQPHAVMVVGTIYIHTLEEHVLFPFLLALVGLGSGSIWLHGSYSGFFSFPLLVPCSFMH